MNDQDEMFERATELPVSLGCPQHMPKTLPGGFDGVEPAGAQGGEGVPPSQEEAKAKLEASVLRQREVLNKIVDIALSADAKAGKQETKLGSKYLECSKAICSIRELCGPDLVEKAQIESGAFYTPGWLCELAKKLDSQNANLRESDESTRMPVREDSPNSPDSRSDAELTPEEQSALQREEARQKRKIHWTAYPTKVDVCVMGKTEQNCKVYEVRISKRGDSKVQDTYAQCKVNGKGVLTCSFTGSAWMLKRILTSGMQALVNYKAKKNRDNRRSQSKRARAEKGQQAHDNKAAAANLKPET